MTVAFLIEIALKSLLLSGMALLLLHLVRGRSAAEKSFLAHACLLAILVLPFASAQLPILKLPILPSILAPVSDMADPAPIPLPASDIDTERTGPAAAIAAAPTASVRLGLILLFIPTCGFLFGVVFGLLRLQRLRHRATVLQDETWLKALARAQDRMDFKEGTALLVSGDIKSPVSWGLVRPIILLDPAAVQDAQRAEAIIAHELAHVVRMDWAKMILARIVVAVFWFNPLVWRLAAEAHQLREESADDAVLRAAVGQKAYASLLVDVVRHQQNPTLTPAHGVAPGVGSLKRRVIRILDDTLPRNTAGRSWAASSFAALGLIVLPLAMVTPVEAQNAPRSAQNQSLSDAETQTADAQTGRRAQPSVDDLVEMQIHGVTSDWIAALEAANPQLTRLSHRQLIELRIHGVDPAFLRELADSGFPQPSFGEIRGAAIHGVNRAYIEGLAAAGYTNLTLSDLTRLRIHGVSPRLINGLAQAGFEDLSADELREAAIHGISPEFITGMTEVWPSGLTFGSLVDLRIAGVGPDFVQAFKAAGYRNLTPQEAINLRRHGVQIEDVSPHGTTIED